MSDWPESDEGTRIYIGSVGPMLYNADDVLEDEDADDPYFGHAVEGITSEGPGEFSSITSTETPTEPNQFARLQDLDDRINELGLNVLTE